MLQHLRDKKVIFFDVGYTLDKPASGDWMFTNRFLEEAGAALLDRDNRRVSLTERGKKFLAFAREAVTKRRGLLEEFSKGSDLLSGDLKVYASVTACYTILPPFIKELSQKYPAVRLSVQTGGEAGAFGAVKEGRVLLAVAAASAPVVMR